MVASMVILRAFITFVNISSQIVQVLGFIRLGRMPNRRNGTDATPRSGTGTCICCQQPLQILDCCTVTEGVPHPASRRLGGPRATRSLLCITGRLVPHQDPASRKRGDSFFPIL